MAHIPRLIRSNFTRSLIFVIYRVNPHASAAQGSVEAPVPDRCPDTDGGGGAATSKHCHYTRIKWQTNGELSRVNLVFPVEPAIPAHTDSAVKNPKLKP